MFFVTRFYFDNIAIIDCKSVSVIENMFKLNIKHKLIANALEFYSIQNFSLTNMK